MNESNSIDLVTTAADIRKVSGILGVNINVDADGKNLEALGPQALSKLGEVVTGLGKVEDHGPGFGLVIGKMKQIETLTSDLYKFFSAQKNPDVSEEIRKKFLEDVRSDIEEFGSSGKSEFRVINHEGHRGYTATITYSFTYKSGEPSLGARSFVMSPSGEIIAETFKDDDLKSFNNLADFRNYLLKDSDESAVSPLLRAVNLLGELSKNVDKKISVVADGGELKQLGGGTIRRLNTMLNCLRGINRYGENFKEFFAGSINVVRLVSSINNIYLTSGDDRMKAIGVAKSLIDEKSPHSYLGSRMFRMGNETDSPIVHINAYQGDGDVYLKGSLQQFCDGKWSEIKGYSEAQILALGSPEAFAKMAFEGLSSCDRPQTVAGLSDARIAIAGDVLPPVRTHCDDDRSKPDVRLNDSDPSVSPFASLPSTGQSRLGQLVQSLTSFGAQQDGIDRTTARVLPLSMASLSLATPN